MAPKQENVEKVFTAMEIDESIDLHIKAWKVQPLAWTLIMAFILSGALGLFGTGWLSKTSRENGAIIVAYEKYFRNGAQMKLEITDADSLEQTVLVFNRDYLAHFSVQSIVPEPAAIDISRGEVHYFFKGAAGSRRMVFFLVPEESGRVTGSLKINGNVFNLSHFIYP